MRRWWHRVKIICLTPLLLVILFGFLLLGFAVALDEVCADAASMWRVMKDEWRRGWMQ